MNKKLLNTQIKALTESHGAEIVAFYKSQGFDVRSLMGISCEKRGDIYTYYGVDGNCYFLDRDANNEIRTITLEEAKELAKVDEYPKVMWVADSEKDPNWVKRVVFMEKCGKYLAWSDAKTIKESEKTFFVYTWNYVKDIEEDTESEEKDLVNEARRLKEKIAKQEKKVKKANSKIASIQKDKRSIERKIKQLKNK